MPPTGQPVSKLGFGVFYIAIVEGIWPLVTNTPASVMLFHFVGSLFVLGLWQAYKALSEHRNWRVRPLVFGVVALLLATCATAPLKWLLTMSPAGHFG
ncbi:hypothetical protein CAI21_18680 [Alkalilimnicola ehrlichii]|uniref:Uncharacterized protein n=1 Tax=Alkalilimnicola ehrlichii TaxID=351052 RepID=A0A3E0WI87_9GAMM|nr:hypothetical protein CAI21_18680 [Alkalilimnicola ehrlichii]RFA32682.1 hypothetical protein CAL65_18935 [Alkalilimnicola ehrlichii]